MHRPDAFPAGINHRTAIIVRHAALITGLLAGGPSSRVAAQVAPPGSHIDSTTLPEGTIERRSVLFEAPEAACESYHDTFRERLWLVNVPTPAAFGEMLDKLPAVSAATRQALLNPAWWTPNPTLGGFEVRPAPALLRGLSPAERAALYGLLAYWQPNKPERWPIVFADRAAIARLRELGHPAALVELVDACVHPFAGGLAFSDFSVLASAFPERAGLLRFLQDTSAVTGFVPRLRLRTALSVSSALAYWTADNNNPFAGPMLEALLRSETDTGIELTSIMPGAARTLSHDIDAEQVRHDASLTSFMISATLSGGPQHFPPVAEFRQWLEGAYVRVGPPYRFGDLLILERADGLPVRYACAYVADNFAFAKDPVGLGLWRFMTLSEIISRNPHFSGGAWIGYRRRNIEAAAATPAAQQRISGPGPWGVLRSARIDLAPPDRWLDVANMFRPQHWEFFGHDWGRIEALLRRSQLGPAQLAALLDPAIRETLPDGNIVLKAPPAVRFGLAAESRTIIYNELGLRGANPLHHVPLVLPPDPRELEKSDLNPALRDALRRLAYPRKGRLCLSDTDLLDGFITDESEARRLKRLLFNAPALQVELLRDSLARRTDVIEYWRKTDGRNTAAVLRWFERSPDLDAVDLSNLLPPIPQQVLNLFPEAGASGRTNCFWTSLNFFARQPDGRFLASERSNPAGQGVIVEELRAHYRRVEPPYRFGDVLAFFDPRPKGFGMVHMMNYIADDIVLTKNGFSALAPTVFMRLDDVERLYPTVFDLELRAYRRHDRP